MARGLQYAISGHLPWGHSLRNTLALPCGILFCTKLTTYSVQCIPDWRSPLTSLSFRTLLEHFIRPSVFRSARLQQTGTRKR